MSIKLIEIVSEKLTKEQLNTVFDQIKTMDAVDIISTYETLEEMSTPGTYTCSCPFHAESNPSKKGTFRVSRNYKDNAKGGYYCFKCNSHGSGLNYVMERVTQNNDRTEAMIRIAIDMKLIELSGDSIELKPYVKKEVASAYDNFVDIKDVDHRHKVYTAFLECCPLTPEDRAYLKEYRGLSDEQINRKGYRSGPNRSILFPNGDSRIAKHYRSLKGRLLNTGLKESDLLGVPGFFKEEVTLPNKKYDLITFKSLQDFILMPCIDAKGRVQSIQIDAKAKIKPEYTGSKYFWFSSTHAHGLKEKTFKEKTILATSGCPSPASIGVVYPKEYKSSAIIITEGDYKAEMIARVFGAVAITVQGVNNWNGINDTIRDILKSSSFSSFSKEASCVLGLFDGDMILNYRVAFALKDMTSTIRSEFSKIDCFYTYWDTDFGKGIDDLILDYPNNFLDYLRKVKKDPFDKSYSLAVEQVLKKANVKELRSLENDTFEQLIKEVYYPIAFPA